MSCDEQDFYGRAVEKGTAWQWDGPVLQNSPPYHLDKFDWGPLEAIIWIATRDERSIQGALGQVMGTGRTSTEPVHKGRQAEVILNSTLPLDVADHHTGCPRHHDTKAECDCESRGRARFCCCSDRLRTGPSTCRCVRESITAFIEAFRGDLVVRGKRDGEQEFGDVHPGTRVGASLSFDRDDGMRVLPTFSDLRIPIDEIKRRWPADFSDRSTVSNILSASVPGEPEAGRPARQQQEAMSIFATRLRMGQTKWPAIEEARLIAGRAKLAKNAESISRWMRPYYRDAFKAKRLDPNAAVGVAAQIEADLEAARIARLVAKPDPAPME